MLFDEYTGVNHLPVADTLPMHDNRFSVDWIKLVTQLRFPLSSLTLIDCPGVEDAGLLALTQRQPLASTALNRSNSCLSRSPKQGPASPAAIPHTLSLSPNALKGRSSPAGPAYAAAAPLNSTSASTDAVTATGPSRWQEVRSPDLAPAGDPRGSTKAGVLKQGAGSLSPPSSSLSPTKRTQLSGDPGMSALSLGAPRVPSPRTSPSLAPTAPRQAASREPDDETAEKAQPNRQGKRGKLRKAARKARVGRSSLSDSDDADRLGGSAQLLRLASSSDDDNLDDDDDDDDGDQRTSKGLSKQARSGRRKHGKSARKPGKMSKLDKDRQKQRQHHRRAAPAALPVIIQPMTRDTTSYGGTVSTAAAAAVPASALSGLNGRAAVEPAAGGSIIDSAERQQHQQQADTPARHARTRHALAIARAQSYTAPQIGRKVPALITDSTDDAPLQDPASAVSAASGTGTTSSSTSSSSSSAESEDDHESAPNRTPKRASARNVDIAVDNADGQAPQPVLKGSLSPSLVGFTELGVMSPPAFSVQPSSSMAVFNLVQQQQQAVYQAPAILLQQTLTSLHIESCSNVTHKGLAVLPLLTGLHTLRIINVDLSNPVLSEFSRLTNLTALTVERCPKVSSSGTCVSPQAAITIQLALTDWFIVPRLARHQ